MAYSNCEGILAKSSHGAPAEKHSQGNAVVSQPYL